MENFVLDSFFFISSFQNFFIHMEIEYLSPFICFPTLAIVRLAPSNMQLIF